MGDSFETFLSSELQKHALTMEDLKKWEAPRTGRRGRKR
jgi:hypothetical protein